MTQPKIQVQIRFVDGQRYLNTTLLSSNEAGVTVRHMDKPDVSSKPQQRTLFYPIHRIEEIEFFSPLPGDEDFGK